MKRVRVILVVIIILAIGVIGLTIFNDREPRYQGRTLSKWIDDARRYNAGDAQCEAASNAVQHIGTNAIPWLMGWGTNQSFVGDGVATWVNSRFSPHIHLLTDDEKRTKALEGFRLLGVEPQPLWFAYTRMTERANPTNEDLDAFQGLNWLINAAAPKEILIPAFTRIIQNTNSVLALVAATRFAVTYPKDAGATGVFEKFPSLKQLQPLRAGTNNPSESK